MRIELAIVLLVGCRADAEPATSRVPPPPPAAADPHAELAELCRVAAARVPGWLAPIPETPDGSWPAPPPSALSKRRLTGRCDDASPEVHAALRAQLVAKPDATTLEPTHFDVCVQDHRFVVSVEYPGGPPDFADLWQGEARLIAVAEVAGKPSGQPTYTQDDAGPFADFDGDGVPELASWTMHYDTRQRVTYTLTVGFSHGHKPVVWSHTVATAPSRVSFVTAGGRPAVMFSAMGLDDDWFAPSDIEVFAIGPTGVTPVPGAAQELWQLAEPDRRLRWGQAACAEPEVTAGEPTSWWERHLRAIGATPARARSLAALLVTAANRAEPGEAGDGFEAFTRAIRSKRGDTCARLGPAMRAGFERDRAAALVALAEQRGTELDGHPRYTWGCTTHGETLVALEYGPPSGMYSIGVRGSEIWSLPTRGAPIRRYAAVDPRPHHHNGNDVRYPSYFLKIAGYGDFDGDGTLDALLELGDELDRSHRYFDGYAIWDGARATELELAGPPWSNGVVVDPLLLEIVDGATPRSPSLIVRLDGFAEACGSDPDPARCDWTTHPPPILGLRRGKLVPASPREVAVVIARTAAARDAFLHR